MSYFARVSIPRHFGLPISQLGTMLKKRGMNRNIIKPQSRHIFTALKAVFAPTIQEDKSHLSPESIHGEKFSSLNIFIDQFRYEMLLYLSIDHLAFSKISLCCFLLMRLFQQSSVL